MSKNIFFRICRDKTNAIQDQVDSWRADHVNAMMVRDAEEVVRECLEFPEEMRRAWGTILERARANQIDDYQETGEEFQDLFTRILKIFERVLNWIEALERQGYHIDNHAEMRQAIQTLREMEQTIFEHWPWIDSRKVEEAQAAYRRGEHRSVEEVIGELRGSHS